MFRSTRPTKPARPVLRLETLEAREVPAILIQLDYSRDTSGFFNNSEARATLEQVASELGNSLNANLAAITPGGGNTWTATFFDPATGGQKSISNLVVGANTIKVFVGARTLGGSEAGFGGYGGYSINGSQAWMNTVETRGHSGFSPWGGSITFDSSINWHFGSSTSGLNSSKLDFYSVAAHELGHVLGIGTAPEWDNLVSGGTFHGSSAMNVYGGAVPVSPAGDHWANGVTINGQAVSLDPSLMYGQRVGFTSLDSAALRDLGWNAAASAAPAAPTPSPVPANVTLVPVVGTDGTVTQYAVVNGMVIPTGQVFAPFPGYRGPLHQALADFDRDGTLDVAVGTVGSGLGIITVISGVDGHYITAPRLTFGTLVMVAADIDGDGGSELITVEGNPFGIFVYDVVNGLIAPDQAFAAFGVPGRAALTAGGELDRTGFGDTISTAPDQSEANTPAAYTVSAEPQKRMCTCAGCRALVEMVGASNTDSNTSAMWQDDLLSTVPVA
jgi:hypothetical protein